MFAIIIGLTLSNIFKIRQGFLVGLDFTQKYILKLGIICLGIQLKYNPLPLVGSSAGSNTSINCLEPIF